MFKLIVLLTVLGCYALGSPQSRPIVPMLDGRIIGGQDADIADYPYQIGLLRSRSHICGGGIISPTWILTVAHCVIGYAVSSFSIRAGSTMRNSGGEVILASRILLHANYNSVTLDYDISVIELASSISTNYARAAAMASSGTGPTSGAVLTITGWGTTTEGGTASNILQVVQVPVVSQAYCRAAYGISAITDRMFCAGYESGGRDACQGDSGGPVIVGGMLTGLVSWGNGCARPGYPGVYTSVPALRSWITSSTGL